MLKNRKGVAGTAIAIGGLAILGLITLGILGLSFVQGDDLSTATENVGGAIENVIDIVTPDKNIDEELVVTSDEIDEEFEKTTGYDIADTNIVQSSFLSGNSAGFMDLPPERLWGYTFGADFGDDLKITIEKPTNLDSKYGDIKTTDIWTGKVNYGPTDQTSKLMYIADIYAWKGSTLKFYHNNKLVKTVKDYSGMTSQVNLVVN